MDKLLIVDGHNYLFRGYYGIPTAAKLKNGLQINAFYGFFSYLRKNIKYINPQNVIVVFDSETGIENKIKENNQYKQNRDYSDTSMFEQLPIIKNALEYLGISYIEDPHNEGDDVIGTISFEESHEREAYISTQDQDFFQLISDNLYVVRDERIQNARKRNRYINNLVTYNTKIFKDKWGFLPQNYLDYLSLKGDSSDNIKGVDGIGKIRASRLVKSYGDIENIIKNSKENRLNGNEKLIRNNKTFLNIKKNLDIKYRLTKLQKEKIFLSSHKILEILNYTN
jgi:DNA polymerase-1